MYVTLLLCLMFLVSRGALMAAEFSAASSAERSTDPHPVVFVLTGESNSGGIGLNSSATADEMKPQAMLRIMNLTTETKLFEPMQLGVNNLREHAGLEKYYATCHGLENGLATALAALASAKRKPVYLIKTGQGGSLIAQWQPDAASGYWTTFRARIAAAKRQLPKNPQWVVWLSLGINDAIAGTSVDTWEKDTRAHLKRITTELPGCVIIMTQFQAMKIYPHMDTAISEIAAQEPNVVAVDSSGTSLTDTNHWDYAGLKSLAEKMLAATKQALEKPTKRH